jgi:hypothetical protein
MLQGKIQQAYNFMVAAVVDSDCCKVCGVVVVLLLSAATT